MRRGPQRSEDTRRWPALAPAIDQVKPESGHAADRTVVCLMRFRGPAVSSQSLSQAIPSRSRSLSLLASYSALLTVKVVTGGLPFCVLSWAPGRPTPCG